MPGSLDHLYGITGVVHMDGDAVTIDSIDAQRIIERVRERLPVGVAIEQVEYIYDRPEVLRLRLSLPMAYHDLVRWEPYASTSPRPEWRGIDNIELSAIIDEVTIEATFGGDPPTPKSRWARLREGLV